MIEQGHKKIAFIEGISTHQDAIRRKAGFSKAMADAGLTVEPTLFLPGDFRPHSGERAVKRLLEENAEFTAIFACNDEMAFGARLELYRRDISVPGDVSIIGFDDQPMSAFMTPPLTTVRQPAASMGIVATKKLLHLLEGNEFSAPDLLTELIVRESVTNR